MVRRRAGRGGLVLSLVAAAGQTLGGEPLRIEQPSSNTRFRRSPATGLASRTSQLVHLQRQLVRSAFESSRSSSGGFSEHIQRNHAGIRPEDSKDSNGKARGELRGCVCLVTRASRGIGKGIAVELGRAGATVYVTGTSSSTKSPSSSPYTTSKLVGGPGTIEETAQQVTGAGGCGIPVYCNHADDDNVQQLFETIQQQHGRLDILVNNAFRVPGGPETLYGKFWEQGSEVWDCLHTVGLRSHYVASCFAVPLLLQSRNYWRSVRQQNRNSKSAGGLPRPLIVMISSFGGLSYAFNVAYGVAKAGVDRLAKDMAVEVTSEQVCVVSLWPGVVATERTDLAVKSGDWDTYVKLPLDHCESPAFTGRAVRALALDPNNMNKSGSYQVVTELAEEYHFTDTNGRRPPSIRSLRFLLPTYGMTAEMRSKVPANLIPDWKLPFWVMAQGAPPQRQAE